MKLQAGANAKRSEAQKGIPKAEKERAATSSGTTLPPNRSSTAKAKASGTNRGANFPYRGYAAVWDTVRSPYRKGGPRSLFEPGCLDFSRPLELRLNHMQRLPIIATTDAGEVELWQDAFGLAVAFSLRPGFPQVVKWIHQGHVNGLSIGYEIAESRFDGAGVEIVARAIVTEISLVGWPAFNLARAWPADGQALAGLTMLNRRWLAGGIIQGETQCKP